MDKVSIIIPNYNGEKYLNRCLESVINQKYENKEIIIVDDGSTDKSVELIKKIIKDTGNENIKLICQNNLNGAIARNEGLKYATGKYVLFLDSDDELEEDILTKSINLINKENADMIIGNYEIIDEDDKFIKNQVMFKSNNTYCDNEIYDSLINLSPVPSNKIYRLDIIKNNNIYWGNVRIGQDLNFYLKYILNCKKICTTTDYLYKYRIVKNSISRTYSFKIFDIVQCFEDVKKYYKINNKYDIYERYLQVIELLHYNYQISKAKDFKTYKENRLVINYFSIHEKKIDYKKCVNYNKYYKKIRMKFKIKTIFKTLYILLK